VKTLSVKIKENDFQKYGFRKEEIFFSDLIDKIRIELPKDFIKKSPQISTQNRGSQI